MSRRRGNRNKVVERNQSVENRVPPLEAGNLQRRENDELINAFRQRLIETGEMDRLKLYAKQRLSAAGFKAELKKRAKDFAKRGNDPEITVQMLFREMQKAKSDVPQNVKADIMERIRDSCERVLAEED